MKLWSDAMFAAPLILLQITPAVAQVLTTPNSHIGVAFNASAPLGVGAEVAVPVHERVNVRAGFNLFSVSHDFDKDEITLAANLKLRSVSASVDWFAFGGGFHVSPGVMLYNGNEVNANATVAG